MDYRCKAGKELHKRRNPDDVPQQIRFSESGSRHQLGSGHLFPGTAGFPAGGAGCHASGNGKELILLQPRAATGADTGKAERGAGADVQVRETHGSGIRFVEAIAVRVEIQASGPQGRVGYLLPGIFTPVHDGKRTGTLGLPECGTVPPGFDNLGNQPALRLVQKEPEGGRTTV